MTDINDDTSYDARYGMHYVFTSPLEDDIFFSLIPERNIPEIYSPIIDEENGLCIGYLNNGMSDLYDVYDYNGQYVMRMELPLEHPWLDPLDFIFAGALIYKALRFGSFSFKAISQRGLFVEFESLLGTTHERTRPVRSRLYPRESAPLWKKSAGPAAKIGPKNDSL